MEAIIFTGIQASGKTSFYLQRFFRTHLRLNLDVLRTRRRERMILEACLRSGQRFVVDNTNPTRRDRERYVVSSRAAHFRPVSYYFDVLPEVAVARNANRERKERIPEHAIWATHHRLEPPTPEEGFAELYIVRVGPQGFTVEPWRAG